MPKILGRRPSVVEYYREFINKDIDLTEEPKQCCPFHEEKTPSFSYDINSGRCTCFGKCHAYGMDAIEMHKRLFGYDSREEAQRSIDAIYEVNSNTTFEKMLTEVSLIDEEKIEDNSVYTEAVILASTPERWIELDYVMSKYPFERRNVLPLIYKWKGLNGLR